jgi:hypothetical protein
VAAVAGTVGIARTRVAACARAWSRAPDVVAVPATSGADASVLVPTCAIIDHTIDKARHGCVNGR